MLNHTESSVKVFFTKEYSRFQTIDGNRQLNEPKIKRIMKDMQNGLDVLRYCPVLVVEKDGRLKIIDGQHRFFVARKMGSHVWYIISEDMSLMDIAKINSNTDKWKDKDFINCYVQQGNKHYEVLQDFLIDTGFPLSISLLLFGKGLTQREGGVTSGQKQLFQQGKFEVKEKDTAYMVAEKVKLFKDYPGHNSGAFIQAIVQVIKSGKVPVEDLCEKWAKDKRALTVQRNSKGYLFALEAIYNQGAHTRKVIY
jgi:hypothetical protein